MNSLIESSNARVAMAREAERFAVRVGGDDVVTRSGTLIDEHTIVTLALSAEPDETVPVQTSPESNVVAARVTYFDPGSGVTVLKLPEGVVPANVDGRKPPSDAEALPERGATLMTVAYPSAEGYEARVESVRCIGRDESYLQSDGASFPGFAGAPVVDAAGRLVGMAGLGSGGNDRLIWPASLLRRAASGVPMHPETETRRAYFGVTSQQVTIPEDIAAGIPDDGDHAGGERSGALITNVAADSPAEAADLRYGDVIVAVGGHAADGPHRLSRLIAGLGPGEAVVVQIVRAGTHMNVSLVPGESHQSHHGVHRRWRHWAAAQMMG